MNGKKKSFIQDSEILKQLHDARHNLSITTTLRQDIVEPSLETVKARDFLNQYKETLQI